MALLAETFGNSMSPTILGASSVVFIVYLLLQYLGKRSALKNIPTYGTPTFDSLEGTLTKAMEESKDKPFFLPEVRSNRHTLILPTRYINDIKSLPNSVASFETFVYSRLHGKYTGIGVFDQSMVHTVKNDLTRNIARTLDGLQDEADFCIPEIFGSCDDWTPITFYPEIAKVIAYLSGRIFVGLPLCRDEDWLRITIAYTFNCFSATEPLSKVNPLIRPYKGWRIPEVQNIIENRDAGAKLLRPLIEGRLEAMKDPNFNPPADMVQFLLDNAELKDKENVIKQCRSQLNLSMAAIHTTAMNASHVIYDMCARPEYIQPLREEIEEVLAADGGKFVKTNMNKLKKLDSFIKESQRLSPPGFVNMGREALQDITLHDGFRIPAGQQFAFSALSINQDEANYPNASTFDGFRFAKLREKPENQNKYQLVTTGLDAIAFGHGAHACPGRFFASNEIKIILAGLLTRYDIALGKNGEKGPRPQNIISGAVISPDPQATVYFKRRT